MLVNTNKTSLVSFNRRHDYPAFKYCLNGSLISSEPNAKYLGITLCDDLTWTTHITNITNAANRTLGYLKRNIRHASPLVKLLAYKTLIRPKLEYACSVWDPAERFLTDLIESIQNRAVRFIYSDYSYTTSVTNLKKKAGLPSLQMRRKIARLSLYHKFFHVLRTCSPINPAHRISQRISHVKAVYPPRARTATHLQSFFVKPAIDWNSLPPNIVLHVNHTQFKNSVESHFINMN